jgi:hypothetical protein
MTRFFLFFVFTFVSEPCYYDVFSERDREKRRKTEMQMNALLDTAVQVRVPVLIWGPPGVGKSAAIQRWASTRGLRCWTVIASLREPSDFGGLPIVGPGRSSAAGACDTPAVHFAPPRFAVEAQREGGVIFLDELTTAPPAVQAALLRAVIDKAFGDLELDPARVTLVAAANPPTEAAGGWDLAPPLANRFTHQTYAPSPETWTEEFPGYWGRPPELSFGGTALRDEDWSPSRSLIAGFLRARPQLLLQVPQESSRRGQAWPSPRSWDFASRLHGRLHRAGVALNDMLPLLAGCVGEGPALEFLSWARELDLPDPEELLAHPGCYIHPQRRDQAYAVLSAVCQAAIGRLTERRWKAAWNILARAARESGADVAAASARSLARAGREDLPLPVAEIRAFFPVLQAAGLIGA